VSVENAYRLGKLIIIGMAVQLMVIGYVFYQSYKGREDVVLNARAGCERGKIDRADNAEGWRIAEDARRAAGQIDVANKYDRIASSLESRSRINCSDKFPKAGLLP
jgi:hypothetical protein